MIPVKVSCNLLSVRWSTDLEIVTVGIAIIVALLSGVHCNVCTLFEGIIKISGIVAPLEYVIQLLLH